MLRDNWLHVCWTAPAPVRVRQLGQVNESHFRATLTFAAQGVQIMFAFVSPRASSLRLEDLLVLIAWVLLVRSLRLRGQMLFAVFSRVYLEDVLQVRAGAVPAMFCTFLSLIICLVWSDHFSDRSQGLAEALHPIDLSVKLLNCVTVISVQFCLHLEPAGGDVLLKLGLALLGRTATIPCVDRLIVELVDPAGVVQLIESLNVELLHLRLLAVALHLALLHDWLFLVLHH